MLGEMVTHGRPYQELEQAGQPPPQQKVFVPSSRGAAQNVYSLFELWKLLTDSNIVDLVVKYTNQEIRHRALTHDQEAASSIEDPDDPPDEDSGDEDAETPDQQRKPSSFGIETNSTELQALFGLLYL